MQEENCDTTDESLDFEEHPGRIIYFDEFSDSIPKKTDRFLPEGDLNF